MEKKNKVNLPWQFSTAGIVLGFFVGMIPALIALLGNHQIKQGKDVGELELAYNIIFIVSIVSIVFLFMFFLIAILASIPAYSSY